MTFKKGDKGKVDTYRIEQWPERIVAEVEILETPKKYAKKVLCYIASPVKGNFFVWIKDIQVK